MLAASLKCTSYHFEIHVYLLVDEMLDQMTF